MWRRSSLSDEMEEMMKRLFFSLLFLFIPVSAMLLYAEDDITGEQVYISYLAGNVQVDETPDNEKDDFETAELNMALSTGAVIRTGREALCEISTPDGSKVQISSGSVFVIEEVLVRRDTGSFRQKFNLLFGRLRASVEKLTAADSTFDVVSGTALAGVRGTDYGVSFDGLKTDVYVFDGAVKLESLTDSFEPVLLEKGKMSSVVLDGVPEPVTDIPDEVLDEWDEELEKLSKDTPQEVAEKVTPDDETKQTLTEKDRGLSKKIFSFNAYLGTVTFEDQVYARWVFAPEFTIGKLGIGLYLPAIFSPDDGLTEFREWQNHDEWDFRNFRDGVEDLLIKFYFVQWGQRNDPLYVKFGSIDDFYLGHGFIVDNYSNMIYFPEEIRAGIHFNLDAQIAGFEFLLGDIENPELFGGRFFIRPFGSRFPLGFGISGFHDRPKPGNLNFVAGTTSKDQLPRILIFGADVDYPVLRTETFSMTLYSEAARLGYQYKELPAPLVGIADMGVSKFIKGLGTAFGLTGTVGKIFNYRGEYWYIFNYYEPGIINYSWSNRRLTYPQELQDLIIAQADPAYEDTRTMGFLLQGGVRFVDKIEFGLKYEDYKRVTGAGEDPVRKGCKYFLSDSAHRITGP
jgi:hypothetical protein